MASAIPDSDGEGEEQEQEIVLTVRRASERDAQLAFAAAAFARAIPEASLPVDGTSAVWPHDSLGKVTLWVRAPPLERADVQERMREYADRIGVVEIN